LNMASTSSPGGGSLLVAWQLKGKRVLIIGGGDVVSGRIESVLIADALITLISPHTGLHPLTKRLVETTPDRITYRNRVFDGPKDLVGVDMVLTAIDDVEISRQICTMCRKLKIPVNVADIPPSCDFFFGSQIRQGSLQIMVSTNGQSPKLANLIKKRVEECIPDNAGEAIKRVGALRTRLKEKAPGVGGQVGKKRMRWMIDVCTTWDLADLALLDDEMIEKMLEDGWNKDRVPKAEDMIGRHRPLRNPPLPSTSVAWPCILGFLAGSVCAALMFTVRSSKP
jgi:precorrin-2 dehydrogenase / sirohydrochlorin ferrochelatase